MLTGRQWPALLLCGLIAAIDGFDTQAVGFTGPLIARDIGFAPSSLGWLFSAGLIGAALGAFAFGPLADRFGRRGMLIVSCLLVGGFTGLTLPARDLPEILLCRFFTGVGLGGGTPCFLGIGVEAVPDAMRRRVAAMLYACFPTGGIVGALVSQPILGAHGWRGVFALGAIVPVLFGLAVIVAIRKDHATPVRDREQVRIAALFDGRLGHQTLALWPLFILSFSAIILLALWMPSLVQQRGVSAAQTGLLLAALNTGSLIVSLCVGWLLDRHGIARTLVPLILLGGGAWWIIASAGGDMTLLTIGAALGGAAIGGETTALMSIAATLYPGPLRSTGIGWATGFSRVGQMLIPPVIGAMVAARWPPDLILRLCSLVILLALLPLWLLVRTVRREADPVGV